MTRSLMIPCSSCNGTGAQMDERGDSENCQVCDGLGEVCERCGTPPLDEVGTPACLCHRH